MPLWIDVLHLNVGDTFGDFSWSSDVQTSAPSSVNTACSEKPFLDGFSCCFFFCFSHFNSDVIANHQNLL